MASWELQETEPIVGVGSKHRERIWRERAIEVKIPKTEILKKIPKSSNRGSARELVFGNLILCKRSSYGYSLMEIQHFHCSSSGM